MRSFYITAPTGMAKWPESTSAEQPGRELAELMSVELAETGGTATALMQRENAALNNSVGAVHGGVSSMGLELAGSAEVNRALPDAPFRTASLRVNFPRPFHSGAEARYVATPLHVGGSSGVAGTQAVGPDGRVALLGRLTAYR